jgi:iron-sulfur cluster repair protein YtfE (RIC family)
MVELRILRQLEGQHRDLMRRRRSVELELSALVALAEEERGDESENVVMRAMSLLTALRRELKEHFALEESAGFLAAAADAAPRLSRRASQLAREHAAMDAALGRILEGLLSSQKSPERWAALLESFARLSESLLAHERAEEEMVRMAFMDDLGGGD